jgi:hypothetical protein
MQVCFLSKGERSEAMMLLPSYTRNAEAERLSEGGEGDDEMVPRSPP